MKTLVLPNGVTVQFPDRYTPRPSSEFAQSYSVYEASAPALDPIGQRGWTTLAEQTFDIGLSQSPKEPTRGDDGDSEELSIAFEAAADEAGLVLLKCEGAYRWVLPEGGAGASRTKKRLSFRPFASESEERKFVGAAGPGRVVARIFRWAIERTLTAGLEAIAKPLVALLEQNTHEGLVHIRGTEVIDWQAIDAVPADVLPAHRPAKLLLLIHGTLASVENSFEILSIDPASKLLARALETYDLVIGFDHKTLSKDPRQNASDLLKALQRTTWPKAPVIDIMTTSRGAQVARVLMERVIPGSTFQCQIRRAIMVAPTSGGSLLVENANWYFIADRLTNLAAALAIAMNRLPGVNPAGGVMRALLNGIAILMNAMATAVIGADAVPGLAAMDPTGTFVTEQNTAALPPQPDPAPVYHPLTSHFEVGARKLEEAVDTGFIDDIFAALADLPVDALMRRAPNDLIVDNDSATRIHKELKNRIGESYHFDRNSTVHHLNYFAQWDTLKFIDQILGLDAYPV